jgi:hypothetical protein
MACAKSVKPVFETDKKKSLKLSKDGKQMILIASVPKYPGLEFRVKN